MLHDVISVEALGNHRLWVRFDDGVEGIIKIDQVLPLSGVFEPLREPEFFGQVTVHPELKVVCWPNGADLDSDVLHDAVQHRRNSL